MLVCVIKFEIGTIHVIKRLLGSAARSLRPTGAAFMLRAALEYINKTYPFYEEK